MKNTPIVLGITGGVAGLIGSTFVILFSSVASAFTEDGGIYVLGFFAMAFSTLGIVGAAIYKNKPRIGAYMMLIAGINGLISISAGFIVAAPLFIIAAILALQEAKKAKVAVDKKNKRIWIAIGIGSLALLLLTGNFDDSETVETSSTTYSSATDEENSLCPRIDSQPDEFSFNWSEDFSGNITLFLHAGFLKDLTFLNEWKLENLPDLNPYYPDSFACAPGSKAGESTNKLYCNASYSYQPRLIKNTIDENGNIVKSEYRYLNQFIFDITGKDVENSLDLQSLTLDSYSCSKTSL